MSGNKRQTSRCEEANVILRVKVILRSYVKYFTFYPEGYLVLNPENRTSLD